MWWNNVETKPGTGYPTKWEDQDIYKGGWEKNGNSVSLKGAGKLKGLKNIFHNPHMPVLEDYYEPGLISMRIFSMLRKETISQLLEQFPWLLERTSTLNLALTGMMIWAVLLTTLVMMSTLKT